MVCPFVPRKHGGSKIKYLSDDNINSAHSWVMENSFVSINMFAGGRLVDFLRVGGELLTTRDEIMIESIKTACDFNVLWKKKQGKYANPRDEFEFSYVCGHKFRYGALNCGNSGVKMYGDFSFILKNESVVGGETFILPKNSITGYYDAGQDRLDVGRIKSDIRGWDERGELALEKIIINDSLIGRGHWPYAICRENDDSYIEVIFVKNKIVPGDILKLVVSRDIYYMIDTASSFDVDHNDFSPEGFNLLIYKMIKMSSEYHKFLIEGV